jgi:AcrR family transcriptional regulator
MTLRPRRSSRASAAPEPGAPVPAAGRGRPRDDARREAALDTTRKLLVAKGYDEVTLSEVARLAGVSRPFVYDNWGSKFALVQDAIFRPNSHAPVNVDDQPFAEAMTDLIASMVAIQTGPAYLAGLPGLTAELYNRPDLVEQIESKYMAPVRAMYVRLIERGKSEGIVRPDIDGSVLLDTVRGAVMLHTLVNTTLEPDRIVEHLRSLILDGIIVR